MTQPVTTTAAATVDAARAAALEAAPTAADRAQILLAEHDGGKAAEAAKTREGQPAVGATEPQVDPPATPQTPEEHRAARAERLKALTDQDAKIAQRRASRAQDKQLSQQLAQERAQRVAAEHRLQRAANLVDPDAIDEAGILELMAKKGIPPKQLIDWAAERVRNPELAAKEAATRALDPKVAKLEARLAEQAKVINEFLQLQAQHGAATQQRQVEDNFCASVQADAHPLASRVLSKNRAAFLQTAEAAAESLLKKHEVITPVMVLDELETEFEAHAALLAGAAAQSTEAKTPGAKPNPSKVQPTTISHRAAAERASHKDAEDEWASLSFAERARRLRAGERAPAH